MTKSKLFDELCQKGTIQQSKTIFYPILMHFAARFINKTYGEFASDYRVLVDANLKTMEYFDMDMVSLISDPYRETSAFGAKIEYQAEGVPKCLYTIIMTKDDVENLKIPDVFKAERTLDRIKGAELFQKELKGDVPVIGWIEGPFAEACDLTGIENMMMQMMTDLDFATILLEKCLITGKAFAKAQIEAGCSIIGIGDAICSQIDALTYQTFVKNLHKEIIDYIHESGAKVKLHICGDITHLLSDISDIKPDILDLDWQVDLDKAYQTISPDIIRCGNINPVDIQNKTPEQLFEMTKQIIEKENNRRFIISGGCEITVNTPHKNLMALRKASVVAPV